jgi:hypothetical protein
MTNLSDAGSMHTAERAFLPAFAELIDRLTVDQIKELLLPQEKDAVAAEMVKITQDVDLLINERGIVLNSRLIRIVIALAQLNLHIWMLKDRMKEYPERYDEYLKRAHQLNGTRNRLKNSLLVELHDVEPAAKRTNFDTDGLEGWQLSI